MEKEVYMIKVTSIIIAVAAVIGNALVCHVIVRLKTMKTSINYIILNLAVLDTITGFISVYNVFSQDFRGVLGEPVLPQAYSQSSLLAEVLCKFQSAYWLPVSISPLLLTIMAYERYKAITDPLSRHDGTVTKARLKWMLPLAWILGGAFVLAYVPLVKYNEKEKICQYFDKSYMMAFVSLNTVLLVTVFIAPSIAMLILYGRVVCALRKQDNALGPQVEALRARRKARKKVMWVIITVTLVFYICVSIPQVIFFAFGFYGWMDLTSTFLRDLILIPLALNSAFNPLVYFIFMKSFQDGFKRVFLFRKTDVVHTNAIAVQHGLKRSTHFGKRFQSGKHTVNANELQLVSFQTLQDC